MTTASDELPTALVLAAGRPEDPVALAAGVGHKALVPVAGVPMLQRVVEALRASGCVGRIVVSIDRAAVLAQCPALAREVEAGRLEALPAAPAPPPASRPRSTRCPRRCW
jgi:CTP:molybdopterin cytidylyltransferase MocA